DPEQASANALAATLSETGWQAVTDASLFNGLQKVRNETAGVDLILLASDLADPSIEQGVQQIRGEFRFAATPLLIITKPGDADRVRAIVRDDPGMAQVTAGVDAEAL